MAEQKENENIEWKEANESSAFTTVHVRTYITHEYVSQRRPSSNPKLETTHQHRRLHTYGSPFDHIYMIEWNVRSTGQTLATENVATRYTSPNEMEISAEYTGRGL